MKAVDTWKKLKIKEILSKIIGGGTPSKSKPEYWNGSIPWASVKDMKDGVYKLHSTVDSITEVGLKNSSSNLIPKGNVIISTRMGLGRCFISSIDVAINQDLKALIPKRDVIDTNYLLWLMASLSEQLDNLGTGTTVKGITIETLNNIEITIPSIPTQIKIAYILSAYDDLIENNTRRIKILEEMAQTLYHEWFVKFRFPGHEQVKMVESELGLIPEGWNVFTIRDASSYINRGIAPKYDEHSNSIVINQKCIRDGRLNLELGRRHVKKVPQEKLILFGDVLINSTGIGTLGRVAQVYKNIPDCTVDSHVSIVRPGELVNIDYFGFTLLQLQPYFDKMGVGSTGQTELSRQSIADTNFLLPPRDLQETFSQVVSPMRHAIVGKFTKNSNLRQTRDLLLPKLISGEIDIENLEIDIGKIAA